MNNLRSYLHTHRTALCCVLLVPLLFTTVCTAFCVTYPIHIRMTLAALDASTPAAVPDAAVYTQNGDGGLDVDEARDALAALGHIQAVTVCETDAADGIRLRLAAPENGMLDTLGLFTLTEGRMPQNESECVVVLQDGVEAVLYEIGSAVRPLDSTGDALTGTGGSGDPCVLTVVGIGQNTFTALAPIADPDRQVLVCTGSASLWDNADAYDMLLITDAADPAALADAIRQAEAETEAARNAVLQARAQELLQSLTGAAQAADDALTAQQIALREIENRYETVLLRVSEVEENLLAANDALQREQQEFVSDMEVNEYYAVRQVDLIPRRTLAEESYAKKQAEIDLITASLHAAYADRNTISAELVEAQTLLDTLTAEAAAAHAALDDAASASQSASAWQIRLRGEERAHAAMTSAAEDARMHRIPWVVSGALVTLLAAGALFCVGHCTRTDVYRFTIMLLPTVLLGILLGAYILPTADFRAQFPALTAVTLQLFTGSSLLPAAVLFVVLTALVSGVSAAGAAAAGKHR